jgi:catechol 2,3-dioxygenase-like lactoylglutathione lyase family enzyme
MASVSVRYIVDDVAAAIAFYCEQLGFHEIMHPGPYLRNVGSRRDAASPQRTKQSGRRRPANA